MLLLLLLLEEEDADEELLPLVPVDPKIVGPEFRLLPVVEFMVHTPITQTTSGADPMLLQP